MVAETEVEDLAPPPQPKGERAWLNVVWTLLGIGTVAFAVLDAPYPLSRTSPILVKGKVVAAVKASRADDGHWPLDDTYPSLKSSLVGLHESPPVELTYRWTEADDNDPNIEFGVYLLKLRGTEQSLKVRFDKRTKPNSR